MEKSIERPIKDHEVFMTDHTWGRNARLHCVPDPWDIYAEGYKRAADLLVEDSEKGERNFLVYPIVFLYRHYLELLMKGIIRDGGFILHLGTRSPTGHDLKRLWRKCRKVVEQLWPKGSKDELEALEKFICQFAVADESGQEFRYSKKTNRTTSLTDLQRVNLPNLSEAMARTAVLLEGTADTIAVMRDERVSQTWVYRS